jgi:hypothetical protein
MFENSIKHSRSGIQEFSKLAFLKARGGHSIYKT